MLRVTPVLALLLILAGCDIDANTTQSAIQPTTETPALIMSGELAPGAMLKLWTKPYGNDGGSNTAWSAPPGSRVEVYEDFIIVTTEEGIARISYAGHYTGLVIKRD